jgi:hypothetical protein
MSSFLHVRGLGGRRIPPTMPLTPTAPMQRIFPKQYLKPTKSDVAVLIPFFNPANSVRILQNLLLVKHIHEISEIPTYYIELAFDSQPFILAESDNVFHYRSDSYMFYKENLLALAVKRLGPAFTKLVFLDADILFDASDWYDQVSSALDTYQVIQPYKEAVDLALNFKTSTVRPSCIYTERTGHTGFAWACQRSWFESIDFFQYAVIGGGDGVFAHMIGARIDTHAVYKMLLSTIKPPISKSYIDMKIFHLPHGLKTKRQYNSRIDDLKNAMRLLRVSNLRDMIHVREDGLLLWKPTYAEPMNRLIKRYFELRGDDEV